jgi:hypothetical protein
LEFSLHRQKYAVSVLSLKIEPFLLSPGKDLMGQVVAGFPVGWKEGPELPELCCAQRHNCLLAYKDEALRLNVNKC